MACALVLGCALAGQIILAAAVHLTDARKASIQTAAESPLVVQSPPKAQVDGTPKNPEIIAVPPARADVNTVPGERDVLMRRASAVTQTAGIVSALALAILMFQGVMLAGASSVPGVERAVTASTITIAVMLLCLPLSNLMPQTPFAGVFLPYEQLVRDSEALRNSAAGAMSPGAFYATYLLMPAAVLAALIIAVTRFRSGVEAGLIVTSVSELDEKLEREIRAMKMGHLAVPRAVGALNMAIGAAPSDTPMREAAGAETVRSAPPAFRRQGDDPSHILRPGDSTKRPI